MLENCVRDPAHSPSKLEGVVEDRGRLSFSSTVHRLMGRTRGVKVFTNYSLLIFQCPFRLPRGPLQGLLHSAGASFVIPCLPAASLQDGKSLHLSPREDTFLHSKGAL